MTNPQQNNLTLYMLSYYKKHFRYKYTGATEIAIAPISITFQSSVHKGCIMYDKPTVK